VSSDAGRIGSYPSEGGENIKDFFGDRSLDLRVSDLTPTLNSDIDLTQSFHQTHRSIKTAQGYIQSGEGSTKALTKKRKKMVFRDDGFKRRSLAATAYIKNKSAKYASGTSGGKDKKLRGSGLRKYGIIKMVSPKSKQL
jgi:hypothetical protein